ncbi:hypothetical protein EDC96DRAFT_449436, partial [Choanephora cucurbitarum]
IGDKIDLRVCYLSSVDKGLYVANHVGSLRLPSSGADLRKARTLLERLFTLKHDICKQSEQFEAMENERVARKQSMEAKQNKTRFPYENDVNDSARDEKYTSWVRSSWFPPPPKKDVKYQGVWPKCLFSPPPFE